MRVTDDPEVAAHALFDGFLAALPTETVYGLAARADLPRALARVFAVKGRPADHPLIVHLSDARHAASWSSAMTPYALALADAFWPGPLTVVVPRSSRASDAVTGGQDTVALRVPGNAVTRFVIAEVGRLADDEMVGIAAPSANRFGRVSPTSARHVVDELADELGEDDVVLDGGPSAVGVESTIVDCTGPAPVLLRPGGISATAIEDATGLSLGTSSTVRAPGALASHYAPRAQVLVTPSVGDLAGDATTGLIALADVPTPRGIVRLSAPVDSDDYARVLYATLREADALGLALVVAVPPPDAGVGAAIRDRLTRAAHGS